jgi:hypothetical protein
VIDYDSDWTGGSGDEGKMIPMLVASIYLFARGAIVKLTQIPGPATKPEAVTGDEHNHSHIR